jgi:hypothetical protein
LRQRRDLGFLPARCSHVTLREVDPKPVRFIRDTRKDPVIEKRDSPLFHGSEYSSDSEGDGPSLEATTFFEAWPIISNWIKQNRRAHNLQLAEAWGRESDEHLLIKAFARLYNWRWREDTVGRPEHDAESAENQYRGWEDWLQDEGRYVDPWNEWLEANDTDSDGDDSGLSSMDAELERDHPNWTGETQPRSVAARLYAIGYEPPRISHHGREYS